MKIKAITLTTLALLGACGTTFAADSKFEGNSLKPFLGEPKLDSKCNKPEMHMNEHGSY